MRNLLIAAILALLLQGCVTAKVTRYRELEPKANAEAIEVFTERQPDRAYDEIGVIEVTATNGSSFSDMIAKARAEAAKLGADAIIVKREDEERITGTAATIGYTTIASARTRKTPRLWVIAIAWKGTTSSVSTPQN